MSPDDDPPGDALLKEVRGALGRLCRYGVARWWVLDEAELLLELGCVQRRVDESEGRIDQVDALIEILRELVRSIHHQSYGKILWIVLALDDRYLDMNAQERRELAGREFRGGERPVSGTTIRQLHEKEALDRLAVMLVRHDRAREHSL